MTLGQRLLAALDAALPRGRHVRPHCRFDAPSRVAQSYRGAGKRRLIVGGAFA